MIHYHGTPITPRAELLRMAGKHFCVSFANPANADDCLAIGQSVMWDNGAFSAYTRGYSLDTQGYYLWLEERLAHPHWAVIPDVIDGDELDQRCLMQSWPYDVFGAPVWHLALSLDWLLELADDWPRICFGSSGLYWDINSEAWERRIDEAFNALAKRHKRLPWIHMLRGLGKAGQRWPFASADSANVARNSYDQGRIPDVMASEIDRVQTPVMWRPRQIKHQHDIEDWLEQ